MHNPSSQLLRGTEPGSKERTKAIEVLLSSYDCRKLYENAVRRELSSLETDEETTFDKQNWSEYTAFRFGKRAAYKKLLKLLTFDKEDQA